MEIESHYVWKGEETAEPEVMLLVKTRADLFDRTIARIKALHSYETPEIVAQTFSAGFRALSCLDRGKHRLTRRQQKAKIDAI